MIERKEFQKKIAKRIAELREAQNISQSELARRCFKDKQTISRLESGDHAPVTFFLYEVAIGLGVKLSDIISAIEEEPERT